MSTDFEEVVTQARSLSATERAALAHILIEEPDAPEEIQAEGLCREEVQRRCDAYLGGELRALPGEEVLARARRRLK